jgi:hypothetical protein
MPKRSSNKQSEIDDLAASFAGEVTALSAPEAPTSGKNPAAVALGRLGGKKGGPARAAKLSKERRQEIAKKAAAARWRKLTESAQPVDPSQT